MTKFDEYAPLVQKHARHLFPSVTLAQMALESGMLNGGSVLCNKYNNYFGMKAYPSWKGSTVELDTLEDDGHGNYYRIKGKFKAYDSVEDSIEDHERMFETDFSKVYYARVLSATTVEEQCQELQGTYATDTAYAGKLLKLINEYNLKQYDVNKVNNVNEGVTSVAVDTEKMINHMYWLKSKGVKYSMNYSRIGTDGTADCSGAVSSAVRQAGGSDFGRYAPSTETLHSYLINNGFKLIAFNQEWDAKRADIFILGIKGRSAGGAGHTGIFINHSQVIHCNYDANGVSITNEANLPYNMGWYVYRYAGPKPSAQTQAQVKPVPVNIRKANGKVTVRNVATHWLTREKINPSVLGKTYEYDAVCDCNISVSKKAYRLKDGNNYLGWLLEQDVEPEHKIVTAEDREVVINGVRYEIREKK